MLELSVCRAGRMREWLATRHPLRAEVTLALSLYALYEATRGLFVGSRDAAVRHAGELVSLERSLHAFHEAEVQHAVEHAGGLVPTLGLAYLTLHLAVTAALLLWLHQRRPAAYPFVRTTLVVASAIATVGYVAFPMAPPRLSGLGIVDTVSGHFGVDLDRGLVSALYNPYAAIPSMHAGFALVVGATVTRHARNVFVRAGAVLYPAFAVLVIVATGNHFFVDALAGFFVAAAAATVTVLVLRPWPMRRPARPAEPRSPAQPHATPA